MELEKELLWAAGPLLEENEQFTREKQKIRDEFAKEKTEWMECLHETDKLNRELEKDKLIAEKKVLEVQLNLNNLKNANEMLVQNIETLKQKNEQLKKENETESKEKTNSIIIPSIAIFGAAVICISAILIFKKQNQDD